MYPEPIKISGERKGLIDSYLKQVNIDFSNNYFDTNTSHHHHFFDETNNELIDLNNEDIKKIELKKNIPGKKIKSVEVLVKIVSK